MYGWTPFPKRWLLAMLFAAAAIVLIAPQAQAATGQGTNGSVPELDWQPCQDDFECATARVPLDHDRPSGTKIELALVRDPASDPGERIGSLFFNPGGPGGSGVNFLRGAPKFARDLVGRRFDLIGFDPRGVGASEPTIDCKVDQETAGVYPQPFTRPDSDLAAHVRRARTYVNRCASLNGRFIKHVSTADVARDLDLLRAAVGDRKLSYVGISYGTMIGATYASLFPGKARALVLDSAIDAETWARRPFDAFREQSASDENVLDRFFGACARLQEVCGFGGEDPEDAFDDLSERLDAQPLAVPGGRPVDGDDLRWVAYDSMYSQSVWPPFAAALRGVEAGDGQLMRQLVDDSYGRRPDGSYDPTYDAYFAVTSLDQDYPRNVQPFLEAGRHSYSLFDHVWFNSGYNELPQGISPYESRDVFRGPFRHSPASPPAFVIGGTHDPATPYKWSRRLAADLGNARLVTVRGNGHGTITELNPCVVGPVLDYLENGTPPADGLTCHRPPPFSTPGAAVASAARSDKRDRALERWSQLVR
jgi:pimeloyl-ACP methyl ester carboxylesterase